MRNLSASALEGNNPTESDRALASQCALWILRPSGRAVFIMGSATVGKAARPALKHGLCLRARLWKTIGVRGQSLECNSMRKWA